MADGETIAAIATARGRGGIAVIRISGAGAYEVASKVCGTHVLPGDAGTFKHVFFRDSSGRILDDGLLLVFAPGRGYTGETAVELHTHGGAIAPDRVLDAVIASGARLARRGEFTLRAFLNGKLDLMQAEGVIDLIDAKTERAADNARQAMGSGSSKVFASLYDRLIREAANIEHALDFDDGELPDDFITSSSLRIRDISDVVAKAVSTAREGRILRNGARVVLSGRPNAGKSSLLNAMLGAARVIVSPVPGTTRDTVEETVDIESWPVVLIDTAGVRDTCDPAEREGVERARRAAQESDLVLAVADDPSTLCGLTDSNDIRIIGVLTKSDVSRGCKIPEGAVATSAKTGEGISELKKEIARRLKLVCAKDSESPAFDINARQRECLIAVQMKLKEALDALETPEFVIAANCLGAACGKIGEIAGRTYSDDLLDSVFSRFCVGK